jgi:hypothetical protein
VRTGLAEQLGVAVERVRCERERCEATLAGGARVEVLVTGEGALAWESDEVVLTAALAERVHAELVALGLSPAPAIDCGPPRAAVPGERVSCALEGGGAVWVTFGDGDALELEVALTPEEVRARTGDVDVQGLEDLSRALDPGPLEPLEAAEDDDGSGSGGAAGGP